MTGNEARTKCGIWNIPQDTEAADDVPSVTTLDDPEVKDNVQTLDWHSRKPECLSVAYENSFAVWDLGGSLSKVFSH